METERQRHETEERRAWQLRWRSPLLSRQLCLRLLASAPEPDVAAYVRRTLAWLDKWRGDFDEAEAHLRQALDHLGGRQDHAAGDCYSTLGVILYSRGDHAGAHAVCEAGLAQIADLPPQEALIDLHVTLSTLHMYSQDFARSYALLDKAAALARDRRMFLDLARVEHNRARALNRQGDIEAAYRTAVQAERMTRSSRNAVILPYICEVLGSTMIEAGEPRRALAILEEGETAAAELGDKRARCQNLEQTGRAYTALKRHDEANVALLRGLSFAESIKYPLWIKKFSQHLSRNYEAMGRYRDALRCERAYIAVHRAMFSKETERQLMEMRRTFEMREARAQSERESRRATELEGLARAAEEANLLKTTFLANMSHELRTPLNAILGFVQMLQMSALTAQQREYTDIVLAAGRTLLNLISDILDLTQIEAGIEIRRAPFTLMEAIEEASATAKGLISNTGLRFDVQVDPELPQTAIGDCARVGQVLVNFIGNAAKFSDTGTICLDARREGHSVRLSVSDEGPGVPPEQRDEIFLRFRQGDEGMTKTHGGTGLGLAICKELAQRMGGTVGVDTAEGGGAEFWLTLSLPAANVMQHPHGDAIPGGIDGDPHRIDSAAQI